MPCSCVEGHVLAPRSQASLQLSSFVFGPDDRYRKKHSPRLFNPFADAKCSTAQTAKLPVSQAAAAPEIGAAQVASAGEEVVKLVDQSRFTDLWNSASFATPKVAQQSQFNSDLVNSHQPLGAPTSRTWMVVARQTLGADKGSIAGQYLNIEYETRFARGDVKRELVSLRFDEDRVWRFAGYVLRSCRVGP
jgi:Protein of unknown function (DUF4019)